MCKIHVFIEPVYVSFKLLSLYCANCGVQRVHEPDPNHLGMSYEFIKAQAENALGGVIISTHRWEKLKRPHLKQATGD